MLLQSESVALILVIITSSYSSLHDIFVFIPQPAQIYAGRLFAVSSKVIAIKKASEVGWWETSVLILVDAGVEISRYVLSCVIYIYVELTIYTWINNSWTKKLIKWLNKQTKNAQTDMRMVTDRRKTCSNEVEKETKEVRNGGKRKRENTMEALGKVFMLRHQNCNDMEVTSQLLIGSWRCLATTLIKHWVNSGENDGTATPWFSFG